MSEDLANQEAVSRLLRMVGEDPERPGLDGTPARFIKALREMTSGYGQDPKKILTTFESEGFDEIIAVRDIEFCSLCEHHMLPFSGHVHFAYIPGERIVGLSKIPRLVRILAKRLQVQERLTKQVAEEFMEALSPIAVAVIVDGTHSCMSNRGVECQQGRMRTSVMRGAFREKPEARAEVMRLLLP